MYKMYPKYMYMYMYVELKYMLPCSLFCRCFQVDSLNGGSLLPLNGGRQELVAYLVGHVDLRLHVLEVALELLAR